MRDQTCPSVLDIYSRSSGAARSMVKDWTPLRWMLVVGVVLGTSALLVQSLAGHLQRSEPDAQDAQPVLIAKHYIPPFTAIQSRDVSIRNYPREWLPLGALHQSMELILKDGHPAFQSAVALPAGQPLTRTVLLDTNRNHGMAAVLGTETVAVSFSADRVRGAGGWVQPGDRITIFATAHEMDSKAHPLRTATRVLFGSVEVLAVNDRRLGNSDDSTAPGNDSKPPTDSSEDGSVVTVRMNPVQAAVLVQAREDGHLSVALQALGDDLPAEPPASPPAKGS